MRVNRFKRKKMRALQKEEKFLLRRIKQIQEEQRSVIAKVVADALDNVAGGGAPATKAD